MPRGPRLDAPGALHHVIARGIERRAIFIDDSDREDFLGRVGLLVERRAVDVYAWALMPNHVHFLLRTVAEPLSRAMRSLLAGYATYFNRRHDRTGHLFQNRFQSVLCEDEPYFLQLVRYIHLNPFPSVVDDLGELAHYRYCGHSVLLRRTRRDWQDTETVLLRFADAGGDAARLYERFIETGVGAAADLDGGGLRRSAAGWQHVIPLPSGRERQSADERILGSSRFVDRVIRETNQLRHPNIGPAALIEIICRAEGVDSHELVQGGFSRAVTRAREGIAHLWIDRLRGNGAQIAECIGFKGRSIYAAAKRGRDRASYWASLLKQ